jgi:hypothetical protein
MSNRQERRYRKIAHSLQKVQELMKKDGLTEAEAHCLLANTRRLDKFGRRLRS